MTSRLILNIAPVVTDAAKIMSVLIPDRGETHLHELRRAHAGRYVFFRSGANIVGVPTSDDAGELPDSTESEVDLHRDLRTVARLVREALLAYFFKHGRTITDFDPVSFLAASKNDDLLAHALPRWNTRPNWLSVRPRYTLDVRTFFPPRARPYVGAALGVRTAIEIDTDCKTLIEAGVDLVGTYVSSSGQAVDERVRPRRHLVGRVRSVTGHILSLDDVRDEHDIVEAIDVHVEPRHETLRTIVTALLGGDTAALQRLDRVLRQLNQGRERLTRIRTLLNHLRTQHFGLTRDAKFTFGPLLGEEGSRLTATQAPRPVFLFDAMGRKTDTWNDRGLKKFGPYTAQSFSPPIPRVAVVCQRRFQGIVEQVIYKLLHGVPSHRGDRAPFEQGFIRKYGLQDVAVEFFFASNHSVKEYDRAVREALASAGQSGVRWDLVLVQIEESFHQLLGEQNPYFVSKATLLGQQIPAQSFEIETIDTNDDQLGYVLNSIALAVYAKLGGVPWLLQANPTISHEVIFGLGSAELATTRLGARQRMVGVTTVFTGDGRYHLSNLSQAVPYEDYPDAVVASLRKTVDTVRTNFNWRAGERIRLVFHAFKDIRDVEANAVKSVMGELRDFEIEYAFVHVAENHPYTLFDEGQDGVNAPDGKKGVLAPNRGLFLPLSDSQMLVVLTGPADLKLAIQGLPHPILLKLHRASTFDDLTYLAKQTVVFAAHSWRSFTPASLPVTILYSQLLAGLLPNLTAVDPGVTTALLGRIGTSRWFL